MWWDFYELLGWIGLVWKLTYALWFDNDNCHFVSHFPQECLNPYLICYLHRHQKVDEMLQWLHALSTIKVQCIQVATDSLSNLIRCNCRTRFDYAAHTVKQRQTATNRWPGQILVREFARSAQSIPSPEVKWSIATTEPKTRHSRQTADDAMDMIWRKEQVIKLMTRRL